MFGHISVTFHGSAIKPALSLVISTVGPYVKTFLIFGPFTVTFGKSSDIGKVAQTQLSNATRL